MAHALIFDSGIGGLSVASHIIELMPHMSVTYVADDEFRPYGNKSETQLLDRLPALLATLEIMCAPDVIVIACNTASTIALPAIRAAVKAPVVGVVPAIKPAAAGSETKTIAVLGTPGTVRREYVQTLIDEFASDCDVVLQGSTVLVDLAERKLSGEVINPDAVREQLAPIFAGAAGPHVDSVVLACTHFPLLIPELSAAAPRPMLWIDSGAAIARRVRSLVKDASLTPKKRTALLIGPNPAQARLSAFNSFGFDRVVGLKP